MSLSPLGFYYPILNWIIDSFPTFVVERLQPGLRSLQEVGPYRVAEFTTI